MTQFYHRFWHLFWIPWTYVWKACLIDQIIQVDSVFDRKHIQYAYLLHLAGWFKANRDCCSERKSRCHWSSFAIDIPNSKDFQLEHRWSYWIHAVWCKLAAGLWIRKVLLFLHWNCILAIIFYSAHVCANNRHNDWQLHVAFHTFFSVQTHKKEIDSTQGASLQKPDIVEVAFSLLDYLGLYLDCGGCYICSLFSNLWLCSCYSLVVNI